MAVYYVASNGSDSNDGLSTGSPWLTIAKVNGATFASGDQVLFRRGDRWGETLTVPRNTMLFGAYGPSATFDSEGYGTNAPVIDGGVPVTGWVIDAIADPNNRDTVTDTAGTDLNAHTPDVGTAWTRNSVSSTKGIQITASGTARRTTTASATYVANPGSLANDYYVTADALFVTSLTSDAAYICLRSQSTSVENFYALAVSSGGFSISRFSTSPASATLGALSPQLVPVAGHTYHMRLEVAGNVLTAYVYDAATPGDVRTWSASDTAGAGGGAVFTSAGRMAIRMGGSAAGAQTDSTGWQLDNITSGPLTAGTGRFLATGISVRPRIVDAFATYYKEGGSVASLTDGQWFWDSPTTTLYISNTGVGSVTDTDVVVDARSNCVFVGTKTDVTVQDLAFEHSGAAAVQCSGARTAITRCYAQRTTRNYRGSGEALSGNFGVFSMYSADDSVITGCVVRNVGGECAFLACYRTTITGCRFGPAFEWSTDLIHSDITLVPTTSVAHRIIGNHFTMVGSASIKGCVILFGANHVVTDNYCEEANWGVTLSGNNCEVARNVMYHCGSGVNYDDHAPGWTVDGALIHHNVMIDSTQRAIFLHSHTSTTALRSNFKIVSNTFVNTGQVLLDYQVFSTNQTTMTGVFKDNVLWDTSGPATYRISAVDGSGVWDSDYNLIGPEATGYIYFNGVAYNTLAAFVAATGKDTHSLKDAPTFKAVGDATGDTQPYGEYFRNAFRSRQHRAGVAVTGFGFQGDPPDMGGLPNQDGYLGIVA